MYVLRVNRDHGEIFRTLLKSWGKIDNSCHFDDDGEFLYIPLVEKFNADTEEELNRELSSHTSMDYPPEYSILTREMATRSNCYLTPYEQIVTRLSTSGLSPLLMSLLPKKWEMLGGILVLCLDSRLAPFEEELARAYMDVLGVCSVFVDEGGISGELREPSLRQIGGTLRKTIHVENGIKYGMDVTRVMFSSGNIDERVHFSRIDANGEIVVDMFAGIGYFTLPLAKYCGVERVFAIEKNPTSYHYLTKNILHNRLEKRVVPLLGDNRVKGPCGLADRVIMGYLPTPRKFIPRAKELLKKDGGIIHYHHTIALTTKDDKIKMGMEQVLDHFTSIPGNGGFCAKNIDISDYRIIKSFAPKIVHCVADVKIGSPDD